MAIQRPSFFQLYHDGALLMRRGAMVDLWRILGRALLVVSTAYYCIFDVSPALARWKQEYAQASQAERDWYETRTLTPLAQARFNFKNCCSNSDTVKTKFRVNTVDGADEWWWQDRGTWRKIPNDIIHWDEHNPNGTPTLFVLPGTLEPTCFYPPESGN